MTNLYAPFAFAFSMHQPGDNPIFKTFLSRFDSVLDQEFVLGIDGYQQITSPFYETRGYSRFSRFTYIISTLPGRKLLINWDGFSTEHGYDILEVGDGRDPSNKSTLFLSWSGNTYLPPTLLSDGNEMWIQFTSDGIFNDRGFDLAVFDVAGSSKEYK